MAVEAGKLESTLRRKVLTGLVWLGLASLLGYAILTAPFQTAWDALRQLRAWQLAILASANLLILLLSGWRWWVILRGLGQRPPFRAVFAYRLAGFGVSYFTPGPQFGGEPAQVLLLSRRHGIPTPIAVASVYIDKLLELLANFLFLAFGLATALLSGMVAAGVGFWAWPLLLAAIWLPIVHYRQLRGGKTPLAQFLRSGSERIGWLWLTRAALFVAQGEERIGEFLRRRPAALLGVLLLSGLVWVVSIGEFWLMLSFLGAPAGWTQVVCILAASRLAFLLPVPAGIGTLEASLVYATQAVGLSAGVGLAAGLIIHLRDMLVGACGLWIAGWSSR